MRESIRLVRHRLRLAGGQRAERLFSLGSLMALHRASGGKPRQLMRLGHQMLLALLVGNRRIVTRGMVRAQVSRNADDTGLRWGRWLIVGLALACVAGSYRWMPEAVKADARARLESVVSEVRGWLPETKPSVRSGSPTTAFEQAASPAPSVSAEPEASAKPEIAAQRALPVPSDVPSAPPLSAPAAPAPAVLVPAQPEPAPDAERGPAEMLSAEPANTVPESLGTIHLRPGASLADLVRALYGTGSALKKVEAHNPGYRTDIHAGEQTLILPAVLYTPPASMKKGKLLSLGDFDTPEAAYAAWRGYGKRALSVELVPLWRPGEGLRFHILAPRAFSEERAAWSWLSRFSPPADASVRLLPPFDGACLVFHMFTVK